jgi:hypothetical protein
MSTVSATGSAAPLNGLQIAELAKQAGFSGSGITNITAIVLAESGGNPTAVCSSCAGVTEHSVGLAQVNTLAHPKYSTAYLLDPLNNLKAAFQISGGGKNFNPWSTFTSGKYKTFLKQAQADMAVAKYTNTSTGVTTASAPSSSSGPGGVAGWIDQGLSAAATSILGAIPWVPIVEVIIGLILILVGIVLLSGFNPASATKMVPVPV